MGFRELVLDLLQLTSWLSSRMTTGGLFLHKNPIKFVKIFHLSFFGSLFLSMLMSDRAELFQVG